MARLLDGRSQQQCLVGPSNNLTIKQSTFNSASNLDFPYFWVN